MKFSLVVLMIGSLTLSPLLQADEILAEVEDTTAGAAYGGLAGLLVGGAVAGGIPGALLGGLLGLYGGKQLQESSGLSECAYVVGGDAGARQTLRSPCDVHAIGDQVSVENGRVRRAR